MKLKEVLTLFHNAGNLKRVGRAGWTRFGIPSSESVADHSFRCAFFAMILGDMMDLDCEKMIKMALIHDLAEITVGDITPHDGISDDEKIHKEDAALKQIFEEVPTREYYLKLWEEYQVQETKEAVMIKNLDKLEMAFQAIEYQNEFPDLDLKEFINEAEKQIDIPKIKSLLKELKKPEKAT